MRRVLLVFDCLTVGLVVSLTPSLAWIPLFTGGGAISSIYGKSVYSGATGDILVLERAYSYLHLNGDEF